MKQRDAALPTGAESVAWNLDDLVAAPAEDGIEAILTDAETRVGAFSRKYRGRVAGLSAAEMRDLLVEYESMIEAVGRAESYASLSWTTRSDDPARGALLQKVSERQSRIAQEAVFLDIEWANAPDEAARRLIDDPLLSHWRHWLTIARRYKPHLLSEPEERIVAEKAVTGRQAWNRFFDETLAATRYEWEGSAVPQAVILQKLYAEDRAVRRRAAQTLTGGLRSILRTTTFVTNTILADKASDDRLRRYPSWISARNMDNQVDDAVVDALVGAVTSRYDVVARYYRLKKRLLGIDELFDYDRYAALPASERRYTWNEARDIVLAAYGRFHPRMAQLASLFFEKRWIDAPPRAGKQGGGFCSPTVPGLHPYIFLNFQGTSKDVKTLAHELGHGVHMYLARERGVLQQGTPLTTAETASVFGETLVHEDLLARETDPAAALSLVTGAIEDSFATVFRQVAMNRFEAAAHTARRGSGELPTEELNRLWLETQRAMFGDSVALTDDYGIWWSYIPHFLHTPGYVYAYAFGELLVRALYARYRRAPEGFADRYLAMLTAGGSDWPERLVEPLGVDLRDPGFWTEGLSLLEGMVETAEGLAEKAKQA